MTTHDLDCEQVDDLAPAFVLGALEEVEAAAVRQHVAGCERGHPELAELGGVVPYLSIATPPLEPADALRARILQAVREDAGATGRARVDAPAGAGAGGRPQGREVMPVTEPVPAWRRWLGIPSGGRRGWATAAVALILLVAVVGAVGILNGQVDLSREYANQVARITALAAQPGARTISITGGQGTGPTGSAVIAPNGGGVVLDGLAPLSGGQVYEVWVIAGGSTPEPAGALKITADGRGWLDAVAPSSRPVTIAVTREPGPGATTPTLPILASGTG